LESPTAIEKSSVHFIKHSSLDMFVDRPVTVESSEEAPDPDVLD